MFILTGERKAMVAVMATRTRRMERNRDILDTGVGHKLLVNENTRLDVFNHKATLARTDLLI